MVQYLNGNIHETFIKTPVCHIHLVMLMPAVENANACKGNFFTPSRYMIQNQKLRNYVWRHYSQWKRTEATVTKLSEILLPKVPNHASKWPLVSGTGVFLWILQNFQEQLFYRTHPDDSFWHLRDLRNTLYCLDAEKGHFT